MTGNRIITCMFISSVWACVGAAAADGENRYLGAVARFSDTVVDRGTDRYGSKDTPLFVDGLHAETLEPVRWLCRGQTWVLCNFASQQPLMRTLDGLTAVTGDEKYRRAAEDAARYAMKHLASPNGLLYWGGHLAWDLETEKAVGQYADVHELKNHQPYYGLMWRVDRDGARGLTEGIWATHILDWSKLDYNRHSSVTKRLRPQWGHEFDYDIEVPFPAEGSNLSFVNVTAPLTHAGVSLSVAEKNMDALTWVTRLIERWQQGRDSETRLCGGQLSYRENDRAQEALGHVHPKINEAKIVASYHQIGRYHNLPLAQMQAGETLISAGDSFAKAGRQFIEWASEDLKVYGKHCYDESTGRFNAVMIDGTAIKWRESKTGYYVPSSFAPRRPDGFLLWGYAMAYRLTGETSHWDMARNICRQFDLGDIGDCDGGSMAIDLKTSHRDWRTIYVLLELHGATDDEAFLSLARRVGDNLIAIQGVNGLFARPGRKWARTGDEVPLALLHLAAAIEGKSSKMPQAIFDGRFFHCEYHGELDDSQQKRADKRTYDHLVFYGE